MAIELLSLIVSFLGPNTDWHKPNLRTMGPNIAVHLFLSQRLQGRATSKDAERT